MRTILCPWVLPSHHLLYNPSPPPQHWISFKQVFKAIMALWYYQSKWTLLCLVLALCNNCLTFVFEFCWFILFWGVQSKDKTKLDCPIPNNIHRHILSPIVCNSPWKLWFETSRWGGHDFAFRWLDWCFVKLHLWLIILFGYSESDILDILDFPSERHTAENLLLEVSNIVNSICINWAQIKCCWIDSPSTMIKFRCLLNKRHKYIIVLFCSLHTLSLLAKDLCKFEDAVPIVKSNCMLVNFLTSSHVWFHNS